MSTARQELRDLIRSKLADGMTPDQAADAVAALFHEVSDEWRQIDISTMAEGPGGRWLDQRSIVAKATREAVEQWRRANRSVA